MIELKSFSSKVRVLGNGLNKEKSLREKLISSIDKEVKIINSRIESKGKDWYVLEKIEKKINGVETLVSENRFWRYDKEIGMLLLQLKLKGSSFKYGELFGKRENEVFEVELDDNGENILLWMSEMKEWLMSMDDNNEMFINEEKNNKMRRNDYRRKFGLKLIE